MQDLKEWGRLWAEKGRRRGQTTRPRGMCQQPMEGGSEPAPLSGWALGLLRPGHRR